VCTCVHLCHVTSGELQAPWTGKAVSKPAITVTDEAGNKADITLYNIWAGKVSCIYIGPCISNLCMSDMACSAS
jgi:hypothetical protein